MIADLYLVGAQQTNLNSVTQLTQADEIKLLEGMIIVRGHIMPKSPSATSSQNHPQPKPLYPRRATEALLPAFGNHIFKAAESMNI